MKRKRTGAVLLLLLLCAVGGVAAGFALDEPVIEFDRNSYDDITVEFGEKVPLHRVSARYKSRVFHREGVPLAVSANALPEALMPGEYTVRYYAAYRDLSADGSYTVRVVDTTAPELAIDEENYTFSCWDNVDGDLTAAVRVETSGDRVTLSVADSSGNTAEGFFVRDVTPPVITLGDGLLDYRCVDETDGDITGRVRYYESGGTMYYEVTDAHGNTAEASRRISGGDRVVYLTFDDGPGPYTAELLDLLKRYGVKATFFVVGSSEYLDLLPRMAEEGHSVAAHAYRHNYKKVYSSVEAYFEDLDLVQREIAARLGEETKLIRFPGGSSNTVSRRYCKGIMSTLTREVTERGYTYFDWNVSSGDAGGTTSTARVIANVKDGVLHRSVAVVLQHDVKDFSVAGVEEIIRWGQENGFVFLPLTERSTAPHHGVAN